MRKNMKSQKPFENSWNIAYQKPQYDALDDPHASYYFLGRPMKNHLSKLRKSIHEEGKFIEKKKINKLIKERLQLYRQVHNTTNITKAQPYFGQMKSQSSTGSIYRSGQFNKKSLQKQRGQSSFHNDNTHESGRQKSRKQKNKKNKLILPKMKTITIQKQGKDRNYLSTRKSYQKSNELNSSLGKNEQIQDEMEKVEKLNKTQHNKFLRFLMNRRRTIQTLSIENDPEKVQIN